MAPSWSSRDLAGTRDAVLVHGLALLAAAISITLPILLRPNEEAFGPALGVALAATGVLVVWALTLAARAWRRGEHNGWCWAVMVLGGLEILLLFILSYLIRFCTPLWNTTLQWAWETGWAVFLPLGVLSYLAAVPVTWWRLRRAAKRDAAAGIQARSHWKRGLIWFCGGVALMLALLLPGPLFVYCSYCEYRRESHTWRTWVAHHTPVFVADPAAWALSLSSHSKAAELYRGALFTGRVSKNRLLAELNSTDATNQCFAFLGLKRADPQAALAEAERIGQGSFLRSPGALDSAAGMAMGQQGTPERIRHFLDLAATQAPPSDFMRNVLWWSSSRPELLPDLSSFCKKNSPYREVALGLLAEKVPPKDLPGYWTELLADSDSPRRQQAINTIHNIKLVNVRLTVLATLFESTDPSVRQDLRQCLPIVHYAFLDGWTGDSALVKRLVKCLLPLLDDSDLNIRSQAADSFVLLLDRREKRAFFQELRQIAPKTPEMYEAYRAAARKWLEIHK